MQPRTVAIIITLLPLIAINVVYAMSANAELVPTCVPYLEGCTSISRAARRGNAIFLFRATMMVYAVFLIWYWCLAQRWLNLLASTSNEHKMGASSARIMCWLGVLGALFLILYVDFLGTSGHVYRFMRRYGVIFHFTFTPLAQLIMVNQLYKLKARSPNLAISSGALRYQLGIVILILLIGLISLTLSYIQGSDYERENIIEWNYSLLLGMFFAGAIFMWRDLELHLSIKDCPKGSP